MSLEAFHRHIYNLVETIEDCAAKRRVLPCLTLIYAGMDVMSSLDAQPSEGVKAIFVRWVDKYLLPTHPLGCTAIDLYAARCGIVHTFTASSNLASRGEAKRIAYAWGVARIDDLARASQELGYSDWRSLHIDDLVLAFKGAIAAHLEHIEIDAESRARFERASSIWFTSLDHSRVTDFLAIVDRAKDS